MSVTVIPTNHTHLDRTQRTVTGVNPLRARDAYAACCAGNCSPRPTW